MADEIERKFLLNHMPAQLMTKGIKMAQGYMINQKQKVVRVRLAGNAGFLTIKGPTVNTARKEFEYPIPADDARQMLDLFCVKPFVEKTRFSIEHAGFEWVVDRFEKENLGLVVAEIELTHIDQAFEKPDWIGEEVTHDSRYYNSNLIQSPYSTWDK